MPAIFGYGYEITEGQKALFDLIIKGIESWKIHAVIASGGATSRKNNPGVSEVAVIFAYLYKELIEKGYRLVPISWRGGDVSFCDLDIIKSYCGTYPQRETEKLPEIGFYYEDCALTTRKNIQNMKKLLEAYGVWDKYRLVAYCDKTRQIKVAALAICVWRYLPRMVTYYNGNFLEYLKQSLIYTLPTVLALRVNFLRELEDNRRNKQIEEN